MAAAKEEPPRPCGSVVLEPSSATVTSPESLAQPGNSGTVTASSRRVLPAPLSVFSADPSAVTNKAIEVMLRLPSTAVNDAPMTSAPVPVSASDADAGTTHAAASAALDQLHA